MPGSQALLISMIDQLWDIQLPKLTVRLTNQSASAHGTFNS